MKLFRVLKRFFRKLGKNIKKKKSYKIGLIVVLFLLLVGCVALVLSFGNSEKNKKSQTGSGTTTSQTTTKKTEDPEKILEEIGTEQYIEEELALDNSSENEKIEESTPVPSGSNQNRYPYLIMVNREANCVTVYAQDENGEYTVPVKAMVCSVGIGGETPTGTFRTSDKYAWRYLFGDVYGQYAYRINGHILFHSVPYYSKDKGDLESEEYNKLGEPASLGCVRLAVADAKWLIDNCPSGTTVTIYDSPDPGPLGKPVAKKIDLNSPYKGWDPTDPSPENPWHTVVETTTVPPTTAPSTSSQQKVQITVAPLIEVNIEANKNLLSYLKDRATLTINGKTQSKDALQIDVSALKGKTKGDFKVVYSATDANGKKTTTSTVVRLDLEAPVIQAPELVTVNLSQSSNPAEAILSQLSITDNGVSVDKNSVKLDVSSLAGQTYGTFQISCQVSDALKNTTKKTINVLIDTVEPIIGGGNQIVTVTSEAELRSAIESKIWVTDNSQKSCKIDITFERISDMEGGGIYRVHITATDEAGNKGVQSYQYTVYGL